MIATTADKKDVVAEAVSAHVRFLADDLLEGRQSGTRGYDVAARYVATQFAQAQLKPLADHDWFQALSLVDVTHIENASQVEFDGRLLDCGTDFIMSPVGRELNGAVTGELVFAGYGLEDRRLGIDDYMGLDLTGKIVVVLTGFPKGMNGSVGAHLAAQKSAIAGAHGATGVIYLQTGRDAQRTSWERLGRSFGAEGRAWIDPGGKRHWGREPLEAEMFLSHRAAESLFGGNVPTLSSVLDEAEQQGSRPRGFALGQVARISRQSQEKPLSSMNVLGIIPGADVRLSSEVIIVTAHLDHLGAAPTKDGDDAIFNGATDNAAGVAVMIEVARALATAKRPLARTIVFAAVSAEEDGLLGSDFLARNLPAKNGKIVAAINLDMPILTHELKSVIAFGAEQSTLGAVVAASASRLGLDIEQDPAPEEEIFARSDQYSFARSGIPAIFVWTGVGGDAVVPATEYLTNHYHDVTDDLSQPFDWKAGADFVRLNTIIVDSIANAIDPPAWLGGCPLCVVTSHGNQTSRGQD